MLGNHEGQDKMELLGTSRGPSSVRGGYGSVASLSSLSVWGITLFFKLGLPLLSLAIFAQCSLCSRSESTPRFSALLLGSIFFSF